MNRFSRNAFLLVLVLSGFALLFGIGGIPLWDDGETEFVQTIQTMAEERAWFHPRMFSAGPGASCPLPYWLTTLSILVFGINPFAVRFPAALMTLLTVLLVYFSATKLFNERAGFWAGLILGSNVMMFSLGKAAGGDAVFLFFLTASLVCFLQKKYWLMYISCGLSILAKGPSAFLMTTAVILLYLLLRGDLKRLRRMHPARGILLLILLCLPWYILLYRQSGGTAVFFLQEPVSLLFPSGVVPGAPVVLGECGRQLSGPVYFLILLLGMYPWTGLFFKAMKDGFCESRTEDLYRNLFFQVWWLITCLVFLLAPVKNILFLLPAFPAVSLLAGWDIDRMLREDSGHYSGWAAGSLAGCLLMAGVCLMVAGQYAALTFGGVVLSGLTLLSAAGIGAALLLYRDGALGAWLHVAAGLLWMLVVFVFIIPLLYSGPGR